MTSIDSFSSPGQARTASGRKVRKSNDLNILFNSRYRNPDNVKTLMGELQPLAPALGKAFAIIAVMTHGPNLPTGLEDHNLRHSLFMAAAKCALSDEQIQAVLAHPEKEEKRILYHKLLTTSCRPFSTMLYIEARDFFQTRVTDALYIILSTNCTWDFEVTNPCFISKYCLIASDYT
jgi:hypothetical protein